MEILIKAAQLILSLSILVLVHELGHFVFARIFKVRVEKFYLFFDINFSLFKFKPKNSDTEYGIGWLPLGGYCKISGMIDESLDTEHLKEEPKEWEFRSKPAWQRLLIMIGGVLFNLILAFFIYTMTLCAWGDAYIATKDAKYGIACDSLALEMGFQNGDKILAVGGKEVEKFFDVQKAITHYKAKTVTIDRNGQKLDVSIDYDKYIPRMIKGMIFEPLVPFVIDSIPVNSINLTSGLKSGDEIINLNGLVTNNTVQIKQELPKYKGQDINIVAKRGADTVTINAKVSDEGVLGIYLKSPYKLLNVTELNYNIFSAFPAAVSKAMNRLKDQVYEVKLMFTPKTETYKQVGSFIAIGSIYAANWDWQRFWELTAFLSIMLAVLNLLPIPALDGGHVMFLLYEVITGRKPSDTVMQYAQLLGLFLLLIIMIFAIGNDVLRYIIR